MEGQPIPAMRVTRFTLWKAKAYSDYKTALAWVIKTKLKPLKPITEDITIKSIAFYREGNRRADIDNLLKCVQDALQLSGYIKNDNQITEIEHLTVLHGCTDPRVEIEL